MTWKNSMICVAAFAVLALAGCNKQPSEDASGEEQTPATSVEVQTATVQQGLMRRITPVSGTLGALPDRDVKIAPMVPGRINEILVVEGDSVAKGELIAKLDDTTLQDQLEQAKAALDNARSNEDRAARLFERGIASGKEKEDAHKEFITAQAAYNTALTQVQRAQIHSPIAGMVVKRFLSLGEQVDGTGNSPIVEVANFDPIILMANLPTSVLAAIHEGQHAEVHTDAFHDRSFSGTLVAVLPSVDPASGSATVRIEIPNGEHLLKGGMFAAAGILTDTHPDALYVPSAALVVTNNDPKVFVVGKDSKAEERKVRIGWRDGDRVEIVQGLRTGEVVVTTGSYGLADGMTLIVKKPS